MNTYKYLLFVFIAALVTIGCNESQTQSVKQNRLIAAENMQLREELKQRDEVMEKLKDLNKKELEEKKTLLAAAQKEIETWKQRSKENIRDQVKDILDILIQENIDLRKEIRELKEQLEAQRIQISSLENMLQAKPDNK